MPTFTLMNPNEGQYIFCVRLVNDCGNGPFSQCLLTEVSLCDKPSPPTVLVSEVQCEVKIEWFDNFIVDQ